jgi:hypothetical protein
VSCKFYDAPGEFSPLDTGFAKAVNIFMFLRGNKISNNIYDGLLR